MADTTAPEPESIDPHGTATDNTFGPILMRQARETLRMLRECIDNCPDELWHDPSAGLLPWHEAYHALFFLDLFARTPFGEYRYDRFGYDVPEEPGDAASLTREELHDVFDQVWQSSERFGEFNDEQLTAQVGFIAGSTCYGIRHVQAHVARIAFVLAQHGHPSANWQKE